VDVNLEVEKGEVFGFLGPNGAGKTTTIRVLLDLIRPTKGKAFVFEIESSAKPAAIHKRIGYLPGEFSLYDRLTGAQTLEYFGNLRGGVDPAYQKQLIERFDLDPTRRFREYSKGNKQKVGLVAALQHQPELLLLDEPTSGLDPLVQQTFFTIMRAQVKDGATVFLSSHILSEVERSCDRVAIIRDGRLVQVDRVDALRDLAHHQVELRFAGEPPVEEFKKLAGVSDLAVEDHLLRLRVFGPITPVVQAAARLGVTDFLSREPSLEETFLAQYGRESAEAPAAEAPAGEAPAGEVN
jgi:ABC-2 type transport system ATP-binding protein